MSTHEMPQPVAAGPGAVVVEFPWSQAILAVAALDIAASELSSHAGERADMNGRLSAWEGRYRDEFDEVHGDLEGRSSELVEALRGLAGAIVGGAEDAVNAQMAENTRAAEAAAAAAATTTTTAATQPVGP